MSGELRNLRLIARLDVKLSNVIKGRQMEGWRKVGDPADMAERYAQAGADELLFMDVVASLYDRNSLHDTVRQTAARVFIPMTIGGGVRTVDDAGALLACGADKVAVNTGATRDPSLVTRMADSFGSQATVVSIEVGRAGSGWEALTDNGRNRTGRPVVEWARQVEDLGAGEIILTSVERDGMGVGLDIDLARATCKAVKIPVVVGGGLGKAEHLADLVRQTDASAAATAQGLHGGMVTMNELRATLSELGCYVRPLITPHAPHNALESRT